MFTIEGYIQDIVESVQCVIDEHFHEADAEQIGLDSRASGCLYVSKDAIAIQKQYAKPLAYYGGFEYVEPECIVEIGEFIFYLNTSGRVDTCIKFFQEHN